MAGGLGGGDGAGEGRTLRDGARAFFGKRWRWRWGPHPHLVSVRGRGGMFRFVVGDGGRGSCFGSVRCGCRGVEGTKGNETKRARRSARVGDVLSSIVVNDSTELERVHEIGRTNWTNGRRSHPRRAWENQRKKWFVVTLRFCLRDRFT